LDYKIAPWRNLRKRNLRQSNRLPIKSATTQILLRQFDWVTQVTLTQDTPHGEAASYIGRSVNSA